MNPVFFTDRDLGKRFPQILAAAGTTVERHRDHFAHDCPDEAWLESVGQRGWVVVTHDAAFAKPFVATLPRITAFLDKHEAPFIAKMYPPSPSDLARNPRASGSVSLWYPR